MRTVSIVGARPQFVKLAPVSRAMMEPSITGGTVIEDEVIHTGQHYDAGMSDVFFEELELPKPSVHLGVGSASHGAQTGRMLEAIEAELMRAAPDRVIVYGDTNSTLAGAVAAAKLGIPVMHVEAGLRSFVRDMPEEINRVVADHVSDVLFAPTQTAVRNLETEGLGARTVFTGDVMLDAVKFNLDLALKRSGILERLGLESGTFAVATIHRASNTDSENLNALLDALNRIATDGLPVVFPAHPRTMGRLDSSAPGWRAADRLMMIEPVGYLDMLMLLRNARLALTDSGGLQKEALFVGTPCITLRHETEWPETVDAGGNVLAGVDPERIVDAANNWLAAAEQRIPATASAAFGDGNAAAVIVRELLA